MKPHELDIEQMTIGQIAAKVPNATQIFRRHNLDYCCHGNQYLAEACRQRGLDESTIANELRALLGGVDGRDWAEAKDEVAIRHVLDNRHFELRVCVPEILRLVRKVEVVHSAHAHCPRGLADKITNFWRDLEAHLDSEEEFVFPWFIGEEKPAGGASWMERIMLEHKQQGEELKEIRRLAANYVLPPDACPTWGALYLSLERLERDLFEHIHFENNVLFDRVLRLKDSASQAVIVPPAVAKRAQTGGK